MWKDIFAEVRAIFKRGWDQFVAFVVQLIVRLKATSSTTEDTKNLVLVSTSCRGYDMFEIYVDEKGKRIYKRSQPASPSCGWIDPAKLSPGKRLLQQLRLHLYRAILLLKNIAS